MGKGGEAKPAPGELKRRIERHPRLGPIPKVLYEDAATNVPSTPYYDALNRRVDEIVAKARAAAKEPEIHILVAGDGALVYPNRIVWLPWVMGAVALYLCTTAPSLKGFLCMLPAMYLGYDFYSGVLHVALDDPKNLQGIKSYILFQGCLEFQWHHAIPYDGASKPFIACCADLNIIVLILMVLNCGLLGYTSGTRAALTGLKLFFAYFGQYCHRAAHTPKSKRPKWVQVLQSTGFMTPQAKHNGHHRPPHDENFCLIGKMDPAVNGLIKLCGTNDWVWFGLWLGLSCCDVALVHRGLARVAPGLFP